ncbi:DUF1769-domain-containing protein [Atractiella rhizophila]|nr:DUF1769-domain-containing protein [Atractiella rhizophila]
MAPPKLQVLAGPSLDSLSPVAVNQDVSKPFKISSSSFEGFLTVRIRGFEEFPDPESGYFDKEEGHGMNYSIQVQGRYLKDVSSDDVLFGNVFEKPIRTSLPYGTTAILKFVKFIDPAIQHDLNGDKPWALSPLLATMNSIHIATTEKDQWNPEPPKEDLTSLVENLQTGDVAQRKKHFASEEHRKSVTLNKEVIVTSDFCNGYINFNNLSLSIVGMEISLAKYWDGQPVTYIAKHRSDSEVYWIVQFQIVDPDILQERGFSDSSAAGGGAGGETQEQDTFGVD